MDLKRTFKRVNGITVKIMIGRTYDNLYANLSSKLILIGHWRLRRHEIIIMRNPSNSIVYRPLISGIIGSRGFNLVQHQHLFLNCLIKRHNDINANTKYDARTYIIDPIFSITL